MSAPEEGNRRSARRFVLTFLGVWAVGILALIGLAFLGNPWGNFGADGFPLKFNDRRERIRRLDALEAEGERQGILLMGSSQVALWSPQDIRAATGMPAVNLSLTSARPSDFLALLRYAVEVRMLRPAEVWLGLDTWAFAPPEAHRPLGLDSRLLYTPRLLEQLRGFHPFEAEWERWKDVFARRQIQHNLVSLRSGKARPVFDQAQEAISHIAADGTFTLDTFHPPAGAARFQGVRPDPVTAFFEEASGRPGLAGFPLASFYLPHPLHQKALDRIGSLLDICAREGIRLVGILDPLHPVFLRALAAKTDYPSRRERLARAVAEMGRQFPGTLTLVDLQGELDQGYPGRFLDEHHPSPELAGFLIDRTAKARLR